MTLFFYGPNSFAVRQQLGQMVEAYLAKAGSDYGLERLDGASLKARELTATLAASPFLASSRLVIIEGAAGNKSLSDKLADILKSVPKTTVAVFVEREVDQRTVAFKALNTADKVVKFEALSQSQLMGWAAKELQRLGGSADRQTLQELVALTGDDQWRLSNELVKLVNYEPVVTVEAVRQLVAPSIDQSIFDLVEAMTSGRQDAALTAYHNLLKQKESELYILTMVQWQLRNLLLAKAAPGGMGPADLARAAGMSPYVAGKMMSAQSRHSETGLREAYREAADCELDIKTGRLKAEVAVEQLIYRVAEASAATRG